MSGWVLALRTAALWLGTSQYPHKGGGHYSLRRVSDSGLLVVHLARSHPAVAKPLFISSPAKD